MKQEKHLNGNTCSPWAADLGLSHDAWGRLVLTEGGRIHLDVEPIRAFPLSDPEYGIALCDREGHELLWIENPSTLPGAVLRVLQEHLAQREFVPVIRRILSVSAAVEPSHWEVETDRGRTRFRLNSESDVHRLDDHKALLTDAQGIRYLIADTRTLDSTSRILLERYL
jgi:xanthine/CO dehydrogenase XdhC/CoxF family maturation factor